MTRLRFLARSIGPLAYCAACLALWPAQGRGCRYLGGRSTDALARASRRARRRGARPRPVHHPAGRAMELCLLPQQSADRPGSPCAHRQGNCATGARLQPAGHHRRRQGGQVVRPQLQRRVQPRMQPRREGRSAARLRAGMLRLPCGLSARPVAGRVMAAHHVGAGPALRHRRFDRPSCRPTNQRLAAKPYV